jgi:hypothetical protein
MRFRFLASAFLLLTLAIGSLAFAGTAHAAPDHAQLCVNLSAKLKTAQQESKAAEKNFRDAAPNKEISDGTLRDFLDKIDQVTKEPDSPEKTEKLAALNLKVNLLRVSIAAHIKLKDAQKAYDDEKCAPAPSTPPTSSSPAPKPPTDRYDCVDFPLEDGTTAQQQYDKDRTDAKHDPNLLDLDGDGKACETDEQNNGGNDGNLAPSNVPSGGVETGNGIEEESGSNLLAAFLLASVGVLSILVAVHRWSR